MSANDRIEVLYIMRLYIKSFIRKITKSTKSNGHILLFFLLLLIGTNVLTLLSSEVYFDAAISTYLGDYDTLPQETYIHSVFYGDGSESYINRASGFMEVNKSPALKTFSTYITKGHNEKFTFSFEHLSSEMTIVTLPYRLDTNRTYMETIRLRRHDVESANYVKAGSDFHIYISSIFADKLINQFNQFTDYDDIINAEIELKVFLNSKIQKGNICNIFYIEEENQYSKSMYEYLEEFVILSNITDIKRDGDFSVNYDFMPTHNRLKNFLKGPQIKLMGEDQLQMYDYKNPLVPNSNLPKMIELASATPNYIVWKILIGTICVLPFLLWLAYDIFKNHRSLFHDSRIKELVIISVIVFLQYLVFYAIDIIFKLHNLFFVLRNTMYGTIITIFIISFSLLLLLFYKKQKKVVTYELKI